MYLNIEKAQELIDSAVAEHGADYVYPNSGPGGQCTYVDEFRAGHSDPDAEVVLSKGCIVGHAFINAGFDMQKLYESGVNDDGSNALLQYLEEVGFISGYDEDARVFLAATQRSQDYGKTWGESVEKAKQGLTWSSYNSQWVTADVAEV